MAYKARRNYVAVTITLTQNTIQRIWDLVNAALAASGTEAPGTGREVNLQNAAGNTVSIYVGADNVSATNCGYELPAGAAGAVGMSRTYRATVSAVGVQDLYVFTTGAGQKLNVEICVL